MYDATSMLDVWGRQKPPEVANKSPNHARVTFPSVLHNLNLLWLANDCERNPFSKLDLLRFLASPHVDGQVDSWFHT